MSSNNCQEALIQARSEQAGLCRKLASEIARAAVSDRPRVVLIGERLEQEQEVLYAIEAAVRSADSKQ